MPRWAPETWAGPRPSTRAWGAGRTPQRSRQARGAGLCSGGSRLPALLGSGPRRSTPGAGACTPAGPRPEPRSPHCGPPLTLVELRRCDGESGSSVSARSGGEDPEDPLCPPPGQCRPVGAPPVRISSQDLPLGSRPAFPLPLEPAPDGRPAWLTQCVPGRALCPPGLVPTSDSGLFLPPTRPPSRPASAHPLLSVLRSPGQWPATPPGRVPLSPFPAPPIPTVTSCLLHRVLAGLSVGAPPQQRWLPPPAVTAALWGHPGGPSFQLLPLLRSSAPANLNGPCHQIRP